MNSNREEKIEFNYFLLNIAQKKIEINCSAPNNKLAYSIQDILFSFVLIVEAKKSSIVGMLLNNSTLTYMEMINGRKVI